MRISQQGIGMTKVLVHNLGPEKIEACSSAMAPPKTPVLGVPSLEARENWCRDRVSKFGSIANILDHGWTE
ncbi:unnamed protein product [Protopolystoma xenopodis]|uniref:Uncharacterized protein n=1 Tax=Protopolystoma xenopodis TaxID=117903 RepID=A0A3S5AWQ3_9PLAT|nr:unnamed protein product [Protopolystoma xenopodis]